MAFMLTTAAISNPWRIPSSPVPGSMQAMDVDSVDGRSHGA
jgi:hypothetical protein